MLVEQPLTPTAAQMPEIAAAFVRAARARFNDIHCFDFVPSDYELIWRVLDAAPRGRFCEWGSGWGVVTGLAEMLGFEATGIEIDAKLAEASRDLLREFDLAARIETADYLTLPQTADVYFVYLWPGQTVAAEKHFEEQAPSGARLLVCTGQSQVRCKVRACRKQPEI